MGMLCEGLCGECEQFMALENLIVQGARRNRGIGRLLISKLERIATERGRTQVSLVTEAA
jgi:ribosomal protein S18 acetylase RimI-like enzyme